MAIWHPLLEMNVPTVPCRWCKRPTDFIGTRECDNCHEIRMRVAVDWNATDRIIQHERNSTNDD